MRGGKRGKIIKLFRYLKPETFACTTALILSTLAVVSTVIATMQLRTLTNIINDAAQAAMQGVLDIGEVLHMEEITRVCFRLVALYLTGVVASFLQAYLLTGVIQRISYRIRADISRKMDRLPLSYFDARLIGDVLSCITNDVDTLAQSLSNVLSTTVSSLIQIILVAVVMFVTSWHMALTTLISLPFATAFSFVIMFFSSRYFLQQQVVLGELNGRVEEFFSGLQVIRGFGEEVRFASVFSDVNNRLAKSMYRANVISGLTYPISNFINKLSYVTVCVIGGILVSGGRIDLGALAVFLVYINLFQQPVSGLAQTVNVFLQASAAATRVFDFLESKEQPEEENKRALLSATDARGEVEFRHIRFGYDPAKPIIKDFSAHVKAGQKVAIVGPTGAGKTTLVNLLMRFYEVDSGEIIVDGVSLQEMKREDVRALFAMVLQDTWLFEGTLRENIVYTGSADEQKLQEILHSACLTHFVEGAAQGLDSYLHSDKLSGGQKQLLTIARAMLSDAPMMILDEATSNVDTFTEEAIQCAMDALTKGRTSFVIAHRLSTIKNADIIFVLKEGDIVEQGNHKELLAKGGFYAELYNSQFEG